MACIVESPRLPEYEPSQINVISRRDKQTIVNFLGSSQRSIHR